MERYTGSQYDDDLTVGMDGYDDVLQTDDIDLFEFVGDEESPITRLKTIILSIDWEITDDILRQFNEELLDLKDIWANDNIKLVYVQALEKISKYIYKEKANANPNAIKLLLTFYTNLEKIESTEFMPEEEKRALLQADVDRFEKLKKQISSFSAQAQTDQKEEEKGIQKAPSFRMEDPLPTDQADDPLLNLKAIVFGMDWEINDEDFVSLGEEVRSLETKFANSKAKLIFLQGIGSIGAYINLKRSNAHADAFKLLHSFFLSLENCVRNGLTGEDEKRVLMPEVEKFNRFKSAIASTITPETTESEDKLEEESAGSSAGDEGIAPAFADMPEDMHGFREDEEAAAFEGDTQEKMEGHIDSFFDGEGPDEDLVKPLESKRKNKLLKEMESRLDGFFADEKESPDTLKTPAELALQGVDVETDADDDSGEEALPLVGGELAPALSENEEESSYSEEAVAAQLGESKALEETPADESPGMVDVTAALEGVEVETEADDDSEETPLPMAGDDPAPALFAVDEESGEDEIEEDVEDESVSGIEDRLDRFFTDEPGPALFDTEEEKALEGVDVETGEDEGEEEALQDDDLAPALSFEDDFEKGTGEAPADQDDGPIAALSQDLELEGEEESKEKIVESEELEQEPSIELEQEFTGLGLEDEEIETASAEIEPAPAEEKRPSLAEGQPSTAISEDEEFHPTFGGEEEFSLEPEEGDLQEETIDDFEDRLSSIFVEEKEEEQIIPEPELDLAGIMSEAEEEAAALEMDFDFLEEEAAPALSEEELASSIEEEGAADHEAGLIETTDEDVAKEPAMKIVLEPEEEKTEEAGAAEEPTGILTVEQEEEPEIILAEPDEIGSDEEEMEIILEEPEEAESQEEEPEIILEEPDEISFQEEEPEITFEESEETGSQEETPVFAAAVEEEPASGTDQLDDGDELIEYIEGVEFDAEEEPTIRSGFAEEEIVFQPVEGEAPEDSGDDDFISFTEVEEELDQYLKEQKGDGATQNLLAEDGEEVFGQGIDEDSIGDELFMEVFPESDEPAQMPATDDPQSWFEETASDEEEAVFEEDTEHVEEEVVFEEDTDHVEKDDPLADLRNCVVSLGLEINDPILENLHDEINKLHNIWITKPAEKIFLQLLSTVAGHIDQFREEASPEAHGLLMSVFNKLELARLNGSDSNEVQESLLAETSKILLWQQNLLSRRSVEEARDFSTVFEDTDDEMEGDDGGTGAPFDQEGIGTKPVSKSLDTDRITRIVRDELDSLRRSFREEMGELLKQHLKSDKSGVDE